MTSIVEKPSRELAKLNYSAVGRYVLSAEIWPILERTEPRRLGRIQLTDECLELLQQHGGRWSWWEIHPIAAENGPPCLCDLWFATSKSEAFRT